MTAHPRRKGRWWPVPVVALAIAVAGCSSGSSEAQVLLDLEASASQAQTALLHAARVAGTDGAPEAWNVAVDQLDAFEAAADAIGVSDRALGDAALHFVRSGGYMLNLIRQGEIEQARSVERAELGPAYADLRSVVGSRVGELPSNATAAPAGRLPVERVFGLLLALGLVAPGIRALNARRVEARRRKEDLTDGPVHRTSPVPGQVAATGSGGAPATDASRAARGAIRNADLAGIVEAALAQVEKTGWEVAIDVPDLAVAADPLRLRRVIGNLLLSASSHGAEHIGIVAEEEGDRVVISIGNDGSVSEVEGDSEYGYPAEVDHQIGVARQLLAGMNAEVDWLCLDGVSLYVLHLVRGGEVEAFGSLNDPLEIAESA